MILLGFRRKLTALALCKSIESAIQWFQIHHRITFATIRNPAVYLLGARVSIFSTLVPRLNDVSMDFASPGSPLRRPKCQTLSSVCIVSQAMTNVNSCKEMFHPYISVYHHVYLCNMFGITPRSLRCKSESGWPQPQAKAMSN